MAIETPTGAADASLPLEIGLQTQAEPDAIASLADLLGGGQAAHADAAARLTDGDAYEGHVALALDHDLPTDLASTLDLLTHAHDLFDVPAMDLGDAHGGDAVPT
jgi:hypothetical protein